MSIGFPKPAKGTALLERRQRRADLVAHEQREMQAALQRDGRKCRVPRCEYAPRKLPIDPCHLKHRGMGGDPSGERTERKTVISLCRVHHGQYDNGGLAIEPLTADVFDGPAAFYRENESGRMDCIGVETRIGVSVERS